MALFEGSANQGKRTELAAEAAHLRSDEGLNGIQIAERLGISRSYAYDLLNDPTGERLRARKRKYDLTCVDCGGRVDGTTPGKMLDRDNPRCRKCAPAAYAVWTADAIICAIREIADADGGVPPSVAAWQRAHIKGTACSINQVVHRFGSWNAAIIAAGYAPRRSGPSPGFRRPTPEQRAEIAARYASGESSVQLATAYDLTPPSIIRIARKAGVPIRPAFAIRPRKEAA